MNGDKIIEELNGLKIGSVVQLAPDVEVFGECFLIVTEIREWGVQGYVQIPGRGPAFFRAMWDQLKRIGEAEWAMERDVLEVFPG